MIVSPKNRITMKKEGDQQVLIVILDEKDYDKADIVEIKYGGCTHIIKDRNDRRRVGD
jgi:hypothetical protein